MIISIWINYLFLVDENREGEDLLRFYVDQWRKYQYSTRILTGFVQYLNRHWIRRSNNAGYRSIYEILTVGTYVNIMSILQF